MKATISNLQHFSTGDGPGIRSTVFFKGCNLRCEWCHNPETIPLKPVLMYYDMRCTGCGQCAEKCPNGVHTFGAEKHVVDYSGCVQCGLCVKHCPAGALEVCGTEKTVDEIMDFILEDKDFYEASGGGVTLSGGEPLLQADVCMKIAMACRKENIHVIIDTAANVKYEVFEKVLPFASEFFVDLKAATEEDYREKTGGSLKLVLENLTRLIQDGADVTVRIPIIPGLSDSEEYCRTLGEHILGTGATKVNILPFHRFGSGKYKALGQPYRYQETESMDKTTVTRLLDAFPVGLNVSVDG